MGKNMKPNTTIRKSRKAHNETRRCIRTMGREFKVVAAAVLCAGAFLVQSKADPIIYTFSGIGAGSVGSSSFNNAHFSISVYSDTADVTIVGFTGGQNIYSAAASSAAFTIAGIGSGTFTEGTRVFESPGIQALGFSLSYALGGFDLWDFSSAAFGSYDLSGPFGPVNASPALYGASLTGQPTTLGNLTFNPTPNITFSAVMVPEPSAVSLCGVALFAIRLLRRVVRRQPL
jgi:hypothetical protein